MKIQLKLILAILLVSSVKANKVKFYDFSTKDIEKSVEVREAVGAKRFKVVRMNQTSLYARFAAISKECVAIVKSSRIKLRGHSSNQSTLVPAHPMGDINHTHKIPAGLHNVPSVKRPYPLHAENVLNIEIEDITCGVSEDDHAYEESNEPGFYDSFTESFHEPFDESTEESFNNSYRDTVTNTFQEVYSD